MLSSGLNPSTGIRTWYHLSNFLGFESIDDSPYPQVSVSILRSGACQSYMLFCLPAQSMAHARKQSVFEKGHLSAVTC